MEGWIKIHRKIAEWQWATSPNHFSCFMQLLLRANHKTTKWRMETINPGQLLTGRNQLSQWTGLSERQVRKCLDDLEKTQEIVRKRATKYSIITISKWETYQIEGQQTSNKGPASVQQTSTSKNDNNANNEKNLIMIEEAPKKNLPTEKIKGKRKTLDHSPLSTLFKPEDSIQSWLLTGSLEAQKELLEKFSHHVLAEEVKKAFIWQCENKSRNAGSFLLTWLSNKKTTAFMPNSAQKRFSGRGAGIEPSELNPTGNPYIQEAIDKGLIA